MPFHSEYRRAFSASLMFAVLILSANLYYFCHPLLHGWGLTSRILDGLIGSARQSGLFSSPLVTKAVVYPLLVLSTAVRTGRGRLTDWRVLLASGLLGTGLFFLPFSATVPYMVSTLVGAAAVVVTSSLVGRLYMAVRPHGNDLLESFDQETSRIETQWSVNIPMRFYLSGRWHEGCVNVVNPFRGTLVMGLPGCGKSFSVFSPYIRQLIGRGFTMMLYDFKMPDLSRIVYNELLRSGGSHGRMPRFCCIDFKDPRRSNRCNPIAARYFTDIVDANETARVVMAALNKGNERKDFFTDSAQQYFGLCLWKLVTYTPPGGKPGDWCDIPHLIELINQDYRKVLGLIGEDPELSGKAKVFIDAMEADAQDQLQGQIASVRLPLNDIASPLLYWILSGDDFTLDINNPDDPKVLCLGNDPKRQEVYGAALSLFTFRVIKLVNEPGKLPCSLIFDELPTVKVEGLDGLMATARSNKVAVVLGIQDLSQLVADYGEKTADKIVSLPANVFVGQVNGRTAERYCKEFGREFRRQEGQTLSVDSESKNISYHEEEVLPMRKLVSLPSGTFVGKVAVDNGTPMKQNFFCASLCPESGSGPMAPMPELTDFHLDKVRARLSDRAYADAEIRAWLAARIEAEWSRPSGDGAVFLRSEDELGRELDARMGSLSETRRAEILDELLPVLEERHIRSVMDENYRRIRSDIGHLVAGAGGF